MGSGFFVKASALLTFAALSASLSTPAFAADTHAATAPDNVVAATGGSNPFADVPANSWAYQAVQQLHADGLIEGYPDGYFKGHRPLTRYEIAVLTQRVEDKLEADLADSSKATKVNADDIALTRKLLDAFGADLADLKKQVASTKAEADASAKQLRMAHIHVGYILRPGISSDKAVIKTLNGVEIPTGSGLGQFGTLYSRGGQNAIAEGSTTHGTGYQILRLGLNGDIDDKTSYNVRLSNYTFFDAYKGGTASVGTPFVTNSSASNNNTLGLDYANIQYKFSKDLTLTGGRYIAKDGQIGLLWSDYFNGADLSYDAKNYEAELGYSFNNAASTNTAGNTYSVSSGGATATNVSLKPGQSIFAHVGYKFTKKVSAGLNYITDINSSYGAAAFAGPALGINGGSPYDYVVDAPQSAGSINAEIKATKKLTLQGEYGRHFGKDPITGSKYQQPNAFWGKAFYGDTAPALNHNFAEVGYIVAGVNGLDAHSETYGQGDDYQQFYLNSLDGYHLVYGGVHHYFSDNSRIGLVYQRYALNAGVNLPATNGAVVLSKDQGQALFLETVLQF